MNRSRDRAISPVPTAVTYTTGTKLCRGCHRAQWLRDVCLWPPKVVVAHSIYDFVDKRIQELDSQLVEFDKELEAERARLGVEPVREHFLACLFWSGQDK